MGERRYVGMTDRLVALNDLLEVMSDDEVARPGLGRCTNFASAT